MATLILGSSGFLGRVVTDTLRQTHEIISTHFQNAVFPDSLPLDIFAGDHEPLFSSREIERVVICAHFESEDETAVTRAIERLLAHCRDKRVVYLSSDAIFRGDRGLYLEDEMPKPRTLYGRNLLACETLVREHCSDHLIIRPSYIYGFSRGKLDTRLARTLNAVRSGENVSLFTDMYKSPLGVGQVAGAVASLSMTSLTGTLHVAGARLSVHEFHRSALGALGQDTRRLIGTVVPDSDFQRDTSLDTTKWQNLSGTRVLSVAQTLRGSGPRDPTQT